jgi:hypothetical protein
MISHRQAVAMGSCDGRGLNAFDDQIDTQRELPHSDRKGNAAGSWPPRSNHVAATETTSRGVA